jgi:GNAT superfamily N-acetyltransferase
MSIGLNAPTRELHANERPQLLTHLLALDAEDRHLRFAHLLSDDGVRHYVEGIDLARDAVFVVTGTDLAIVGAAHLAREDGHAELGISVLPRSRGQGIGGALLARCAARAVTGACA